MQPRLFPSLLVAAALSVSLFTAARAADDSSSIKFSNPAKPGTVKIILAHGSLRVKGADVAEVTVKSDAKPVGPKNVRKDGLRVISAASSYALSEKDNLIILDAAAEGWGGGGGGDFTLTVPRNTAINVSSNWGGNDITCTDIDGDLDIKCQNGEVRLDGVGGGVLVETMNGEIRANIRELHDNKPLSFTSMHGNVALRLPTTAKANVRLRTQNGSVLTDFEETALVTKTESSPRPAPKPRGPKVATTAPTPPTPPAPGASPAPAAPPAPEAQTVIDPSDKEAIRNATRDAARAARDMARAGQDIAKEAMVIAKDSMNQVSISLKGGNFTIPTITGGKLVTGTLNGGGPEISVSTMSGDVILRQLEKK